MIHTDLGIMAGCLSWQFALQSCSVAGCITVDQAADHIDHVIVRTSQPILQRQEILPNVLRGAGNPTKNLRQTAEHFHLPCARTRARLARTAQLFQQRQWPLSWLVHAVIAEPGELDDVTCRHDADNCIALLAARHQRRMDRADMVFEEEHRRDNDIGASDVGLGAFEHRWVAVPIGGGIETDADIVAGHVMIGALDGRSEMVV